MRRLLILLTSASILIFPLSAAHPAQVIDRQTTDRQANCQWGTDTNYVAPIVPTKDYALPKYWVDDNPPPTLCNLTVAWFPAIYHIPISRVFVSSTENNDWNSTRLECTQGATDPNCTDAKKWGSIWGGFVTGFCKSVEQLNCVSSLEAIDKNGNVTPAKYLKDSPESPSFAATGSGSSYTPEGSAVSLWELNADGVKQNFLLPGQFDCANRSNRGKWTDWSCQFNLEIRPISIYSSTGNPLVTSTPSGDTLYDGHYCLYTEGTSCIVAVNFLGDYRYRLKLKVPDISPMFFNGALDSPIASSEAITGGHLITIEAAPGDRFAVGANIPKSAVPRQIIHKLGSEYGVTTSWATDLAQAGANFDAGIDGVDWFEALTPYLGDRASFIYKSWKISVLPGNEASYKKCNVSRLGTFIGIVSSNATTYTSDPPQWDPFEQALIYKVTAPHFMPDGKTLTVGKYALNLDSSFMQCLTGITKVPDTAQIGFSYPNGTVEIATVSVHQDKNWLNLAANNFHFSSPTIKIKFTSPVITQPKAKTITCVKGKVKKVVTTSKCPAGYKKLN